MVAFHKQYDAPIERQMKGCFQPLSEKEQRRYAAMEAAKLGHGGIAYRAGVWGCSRRTRERGLAELPALPRDPAQGRIRCAGAGRKKATEQHPALAPNFFASRIPHRRRPDARGRLLDGFELGAPRWGVGPAGHARQPADRQTVAR